MYINWSPVHCWWEHKLILATVGNSTVVPQTIKDRTTKWSNNSTSGYMAKNIKSGILKKSICTPVFMATLLIIAKRCKSPSLEKWIKKMWSIHTTVCYSAFKRKEVLIPAPPVNEPWEHYAKWNKQSLKNRYCVIPLRVYQVHGIIILMETEGRMVVTQSWGGRWGRVLVFNGDRVLVLQDDKFRDLLYNSVNAVNTPVLYT